MPGLNYAPRTQGKQFIDVLAYAAPVDIRRRRYRRSQEMMLNGRYPCISVSPVDFACPDLVRIQFFIFIAVIKNWPVERECFDIEHRPFLFLVVAANSEVIGAGPAGVTAVAHGGFNLDAVLASSKSIFLDPTDAVAIVPVQLYPQLVFAFGKPISRPVGPEPCLEIRCARALGRPQTCLQLVQIRQVRRQQGDLLIRPVFCHRVCLQCRVANITALQPDFEIENIGADMNNGDMVALGRLRRRRLCQALDRGRLNCRGLYGLGRSIDRDLG